MKEIEIKAAVRNKILEENFRNTGDFLVPVTISNRHLHLDRQAMDVLFGAGSELSFKADIMQPDQFASNELVTLKTQKGEIKKVRVLGPLRPETQVELSMTDARVLGVKPCIRMSGDLQGTPGITIIGPKGTLELKQGVIIARRHMHITPEQAKLYGVKDGDNVALTVEGERPMEIQGVIARVSSKAQFEAHVDTDEANAACITNDILLKAKVIK